jgi:hypothetical protein
MALENISGAPLEWDAVINTEGLQAGFTSIEDNLNQLLNSFVKFSDVSDGSIQNLVKRFEELDAAQKTLTEQQSKSADPAVNKAYSDAIAIIIGQMKDLATRIKAIPNLPELSLKVNIPNLDIPKITVPKVEIDAEVNIKSPVIPKIAIPKINIEAEVDIKTPTVPVINAEIKVNTSLLDEQLTSVESILSGIKKSAESFGEGSNFGLNSLIAKFSDLKAEALKFSDAIQSTSDPVKLKEYLSLIEQIKTRISELSQIKNIPDLSANVKINTAALEAGIEKVKSAINDIKGQVDLKIKTIDIPKISIKADVDIKTPSIPIINAEIKVNTSALDDQLKGIGTALADAKTSFESLGSKANPVLGDLINEFSNLKELALKFSNALQTTSDPAGLKDYAASLEAIQERIGDLGDKIKNIPNLNADITINTASIDTELARVQATINNIKGQVDLKINAGSINEVLSNVQSSLDKVRASFTGIDTVSATVLSGLTSEFTDLQKSALSFSDAIRNTGDPVQLKELSVAADEVKNKLLSLSEKINSFAAVNISPKVNIVIPPIAIPSIPAVNVDVKVNTGELDTAIRDVQTNIQSLQSSFKGVGVDANPVLNSLVSKFTDLQTEALSVTDAIKKTSDPSTLKELAASLDEIKTKFKALANSDLLLPLLQSVQKAVNDAQATTADPAKNKAYTDSLTVMVGLVQDITKGIRAIPKIEVITPKIVIDTIPTITADVKVDTGSLNEKLQAITGNVDLLKTSFEQIGVGAGPVLQGLIGEFSDLQKQALQFNEAIKTSADPAAVKQYSAALDEVKIKLGVVASQITSFPTTTLKFDVGNAVPEINAINEAIKNLPAGAAPALNELIAKFKELQNQQIATRDQLSKTTDSGSQKVLQEQISATENKLKDLSVQITAFPQIKIASDLNLTPAQESIKNLINNFVQLGISGTGVFEKLSGSLNISDPITLDKQALDILNDSLNKVGGNSEISKLALKFSELSQQQLNLKDQLASTADPVQITRLNDALLTTQAELTSVGDQIRSLPVIAPKIEVPKIEIPKIEIPPVEIRVQADTDDIFKNLHRITDELKADLQNVPVNINTSEAQNKLKLVNDSIDALKNNLQNSQGFDDSKLNGQVETIGKNINNIKQSFNELGLSGDKSLSDLSNKYQELITQLNAKVAIPVIAPVDIKVNTGSLDQGLKNIQSNLDILKASFENVGIEADPVLKELINKFAALQGSALSFSDAIGHTADPVQLKQYSALLEGVKTQLASVAVEINSFPTATLKFASTGDAAAQISAVTTNVNNLIAALGQIPGQADPALNDLIQKFGELQQQQISLKDQIAKAGPSSSLVDPAQQQALLTSLDETEKKLKDIAAQINAFPQIKLSGGLNIAPAQADIKTLLSDYVQLGVSGEGALKKLSGTLNVSDDISSNKQALDEFIASLNKLGGNAGVANLFTQFSELTEQQLKLKDSLSTATDPVLITKLNADLQLTQDELKAVGQQILNLPKTPDETPQVENTVKAYTRLRQIKNELAAIKPGTQEFVIPKGSEEFEKLNQEAIALQSAIRNTNKELSLSASNTAGISALKEGVRGLVGGFEAVSGAIALFGGNSKEAEEATRAVIGAMGILNGIEEIAALLSKNSAVNFYLEGLSHKANAKAIDEEAAALLKKNAISGVTEVRKTVIQEVKEVKENLPVDISTGEAVNTVAVAKNTAVIKAANLAEKEKAAAKAISTTATTLETAAIETNTTAGEVNVVVAQEGAAAKEAQVIANTELAVTNTAVAETQTAANAAMLLNPVGIILASLVALFGAYELYIHTIGRATDAEKERQAAREALKEIQDKAVADISKESASLEHLIATAKSDVLTRQQRQTAISEAISTNPEYLNGLTLENIATKEGITLIQKQNELIKARALVKASDSVVDEVLAKQIKAQNELNDIREHGAGILQKTGAIFTALTHQVGDDSLNTIALRNKQEDLNDATIATNGAIETQNKLTDDLGKLFQSDAEKMALYIAQLDKIIDRSFGIEKALAQQQKAVAGTNFIIPGFQQQETAFNKDDFEERKKFFIAVAQSEVDATIDGTQRSIAARRSLNEEMYNQDLKDRRLFDAQGNIIEGAFKAEATAAAARFVKGIHDLNEESRALEFRAQVGNAEALVLHLQSIGLEGTKAFHLAQLRKIKEAADEAASTPGQDPRITKRIREQENVDKANENIRFKKLELQQDLDVIDTKLVNAKKGSSEEFKLFVDRINKQKDSDEQVLGQSAQTKEKIETEAAKKINDLQKKFRGDNIKDEIEENKSVLRSRLLELQSNGGKGTNDEFQLKSSLITQQTLIDLQNVYDDQTIKNESFRVAKIKEINAKAFDDIKQLSDAFYAQQLQDQFAAIDSASQRQIAISERIISNPNTSDNKKFEERKRIIDTQIADTEHKIRDAENQLRTNKGDADALGKELDALRIKRDALKGDTTQAVNAKEIQNIKDFAAYAALAENAFNSLANDLDPIDAKLANLIRTLGGVAKAAKDAGNLIAAIASGNPVAIVGSAVELVGDALKAFGGGKASRKKVAEERDAIAQRELFGQIDFNIELRKTELAHIAINKTRLQGIKDQRVLLDQEKEANKLAFDSLLKQIQAQQVVTGQHTEKFGGVLGIGRKTRLVDDLGSLAGSSFEDLQKLFDEGKLTQKASALFQELQKLKQEGVDIESQMAEAKKAADEIFTGTTSSSIVDTIADGFSQGFKSVKDFATKTEDIIRGALLSALKTQALEGPIKKIFEQFAADAESGGGLDQSEVAKFKDNINKTIKDAELFAEQIQKATGINLASATGNTNSLAGSIKAQLTEETGSVIAGSFNGLRLTSIQQLNIVTRSLEVHNKIQLNTLATAKSLEDIFRLHKSWTSGDRVKVA